MYLLCRVQVLVCVWCLGLRDFSGFGIGVQGLRVRAHRVVPPEMALQCYVYISHRTRYLYVWKACIRRTERTTCRYIITITYSPEELSLKSL